MTDDQQRKYATSNNPTIEALIHRLYRFTTRELALERFYSIRSHFVLSKEQPEAIGDIPQVIMWIKGFAVTQQEAEKGFTGHFACMQLAQTDKGLFTLEAVKVDRPLKTHPQKKRLVSQHPNWGHPVMRAVKKAKKYDTVEAANAELELLHTEFPETSIPGLNKLYLIIYEKREGNPKPTHKIALEIKPDADGKHVISWRDNEKKALPKFRHPDAVAEADPVAEAEQKKGKFASMVLQKKARKKKNAGRPVTGLKPKDEAAN